ncbi:uncharacterized protein [Rutidosis leptorrhynchoides]|uniref:uncharacterized protein n=1 Tax=Rutidosis leptorrhynchoides TaxID=125765 RepID=UPI003A991490
MKNTSNQKGVESIIVNVYSPHSDSNKQKIWSSLESCVGNQNSEWVLCGDFNEVRDKTERQNCEFVERRAAWFNTFIDNAKLIDVPIGGKLFTRVCDNGIKLIKLDRFLISEKFRNTWGEVSVLALERKMSDHSPIVLRDMAIDFGPKPTKVFNEWLEVEGSSKIIEDCWNEEVDAYRADCRFRKKLKNVKSSLKKWSQKSLGNLEAEVNSLCAEATKWEQIAETRQITNDERLVWMQVRKKWAEMEKIKTNMARQKARIKWF